MPTSPIVPSNVKIPLPQARKRRVVGKSPMEQKVSQTSHHLKVPTHNKPKPLPPVIKVDPASKGQSLGSLCWVVGACALGYLYFGTDILSSSPDQCQNKMNEVLKRTPPYSIVGSWLHREKFGVFCKLPEFPVSSFTNFTGIQNQKMTAPVMRINDPQDGRVGVVIKRFNDKCEEIAPHVFFQAYPDNNNAVESTLELPLTPQEYKQHEKYVLKNLISHIFTEAKTEKYNESLQKISKYQNSIYKTINKAAEKYVQCQNIFFNPLAASKQSLYSTKRELIPSSNS